MTSSKQRIRSSLVFAHDLVAIVAAWWLAYLFRFNFEIPPEYLLSLLEILPWVIPVQAAAFLWFGLYRGLWRYASLPDLKRILLAVGVGTAAAPLLLLMLRLSAEVPRSVILLAPVLLLLIMGGNRFLYRAWKEYRLYGLTSHQGKQVLVLGAGNAAVSLLKSLTRSRDWLVVGLLDDDPAKHGTLLLGIRVLGAIGDLPHWAKRLNVEHAIVAMPSVSPRNRRRALDVCAAAGIKAMTVPSYVDLVSGKTTMSQIRNIELDDLLGRDPVVLDDAGLRGFLTGKTVLVTGAGGSIGSELCRQIARFQPGRLVLFERNEFSLYRVEQELRASSPGIAMAFTIGDIKDGARLAQVFSQFRPAVIFHAAAYKHVPLMEQENSWQAVLNNVVGTHVLARAAIESGVEKFVMISTDKAVNPTSVMGASKRLAEMVCQALQHPPSGPGAAPSDKHTRFVMVRFGNVLGSTGSVIPKFREQIAKGGPITVTHPEITRYFMSIPEAAQLVLEAGLMGGNNGGEIFVLDMGEPVKISDLAKDLIRLSGLSEEDIEIVYSGLRPGEKLYEELLADGEKTLPTPHDKLRIAKACQVGEQWLKELSAWLYQHPVLSDEEVKQGLAKWVPEYSCPQSNSEPRLASIHPTQQRAAANSGSR